MRLLILGAGGVGGYFGGRLAAAGADVSFLVREPRAARLRRDGLRLRSPLGDVDVAVETVSEARPGYDAVLIACKAYDLDEAMDAVSPAVAGGATVLPLLNGLRHLDRLDARFGRERVLGGLCHIGVTVSPEGEIDHLNLLQHLTFGARHDGQAAFCAALLPALGAGNFDLRRSERVMDDMWDKFVMLATYAGMTCLMRAPIGLIMAAADGAATMRQALWECQAVAVASGHPPSDAFLHDALAMLTEPGSRNASSMLRDIQHCARTEHDHVLGDMLERGRRTGCSLPIMRLAYLSMQSYEAERLGRGFGGTENGSE
ncbi:MAG: ketopantoate reductase family protein [Janthinobacterium lividum]